MHNLLITTITTGKANVVPRTSSLHHYRSKHLLPTIIEFNPDECKHFLHAVVVL